MSRTTGPPRATGLSGQLGQIELRDLRVLGVHGVLPEERQRSQPFSVDIDLGLDISAAAASDVLDDTVDYGALCALAASVVTDRSFALLEALADAVAGELLGADPRIVRAVVTVRKLRPPVPVDLGSAGVRAVRIRDASSEG